MTETKKIIPSRAVKRLTLYHYIINDELAHGRKVVSSSRIASLLNIDDSQVRKDVALCRITGKTNVGYDALELRKSIEILLGFREPKDAVIVGAGNLGFALAKFADFKDYGINVLALFDNDPMKVDLTVSGKTIFHISKLPNIAKRLQVEIAFLTVPGRSAQKAADLIAAAGFKFIWNFSPVIISVPEGIMVRTENLIGNFLDFVRA